MLKEASQHASGDVSGEGITKGGKMPGAPVEWAERAGGTGRRKTAQTCFLLSDNHKIESLLLPMPSYHSALLLHHPESMDKSPWTVIHPVFLKLSVSGVCHVMKSLLYYMGILWDSGFCCHFHICIQHHLIIHRSHYSFLSPLSPTTL